MKQSQINAINMLNAQIELSNILGEENEYLQLIMRRRIFWLNFLLKEDTEELDEKDYFEDEQ